MKERAINISSVNRQKIGKSEANDSVIKFNSILKLEDNMKHELAKVRLVRLALGISFQISIRIK